MSPALILQTIVRHETSVRDAQKCAGIPVDFHFLYIILPMIGYSHHLPRLLIALISTLSFFAKAEDDGFKAESPAQDIRISSVSQISSFTVDPVQPGLPDDYKNSEVTRAELGEIFKTYHIVSSYCWEHNYSHVAGGSRTRTIKLTNGSTLKWLVKFGGLALITFPSGDRICLVREPSRFYPPLRSISDIKPLTQEEIGVALAKLDAKQPLEIDFLLRVMVSDQTCLRAKAANLLGDSHDRTIIPILIAALSDDSSHDGADYPKTGMNTTRWWANDSLKKLTGRDFGFKWDAPDLERLAAIARWKGWQKALELSADD